MNLVRGITACAVLTAVGAALGACGPIGVPQSHVVEGGTRWVTALDGHVKFNAPEGAVEGEPRVGFRRGPIPADRPFSPGIVTVGDMVSMDVEGGSISQGRIVIDYDGLPAGLNPQLLNLFGWSADLGGWVPLSGTATDAVDHAISGDTILFDSFVVGSWRVAPGASGGTITTGAGTVLPIREDASPTFWGHARAAAASALTTSIAHLTGATPAATATPPAVVSSDQTIATPAGAPACAPAPAGVTVRVTSTPAGRVGACVVSAGTGTRQLTVHNRYPFPMVLDLPADGRVKPVLNTEAPAGSNEAIDGVRNAVLTYLDGAITVGGGQTVTLDLQPGHTGPVWLTGRLDWSAIALDTGLRQLDLLLPSSRAMRPATADALLQAHAEFGPAAVEALGRGDIAHPAVRTLMAKAGLTGAERSVADLFQFSACVLKRADTAAGADDDVLASLRTTGPTIAVFTSDCLGTIYDKYLPPGSKSAGGVQATLRAADWQVRHAVPRRERRADAGQVEISIQSR
ncbi:hypothetical protein [Actinoplanes sp. G11-F43]|uniref:hypothetical protein n=1 Tax=Actinoplanes sp. G11-F43 TaxID=3424130 RepID=UPI003D33014D